MIDLRTGFRYRVLMMCTRDHGELKPNFYHACAEKIFPAYGITTRFVPDLRGSLACRWLRKFGIGERYALAIAAIGWILRHRKSFDIIVGWHGSALLLAFLRTFLRWERPRLCLILYRLYNPKTPTVFAFFKLAFLKVVSRGADYILSVDRSQAAYFARTLRRDRAKTIAFRYGVDYGWFTAFARNINAGQRRQRVFCPGGAYRDDETVRRAVSDLGIEVWRTRMGAEASVQRGQLGRSTVINTCNLPYHDYVAACLESAAVVISAHSSDKPVGLTSLLECMALGRPIIITRGLSSHDYVQDNVTALEFDEGDSDALRKLMGRVLEDSEAGERLVRSANESLQNVFDLSRTGPEFARLLLQMADLPFGSTAGIRDPFAHDTGR